MVHLAAPLMAETAAHKIAIIATVTMVTEGIAATWMGAVSLVGAHPMHLAFPLMAETAAHKIAVTRGVTMVMEGMAALLAVR